MEEQAVLSGRRQVGAGTLCFGAACLVLSLCLLMLNGVGAGVGATSFGSSLDQGSAAQARAALVSTSRHVSSHYWGTDDVPPTPKPHVSAPPPAAPVAAPVSPTPPALPAPAPAPASAPAPAPAPAPAAPPPAAPAALPGRGAATAYGCAAALPYLGAYSAPGFTFECPGYALGHEAMTCINEAGVCDNEKLIVIADPCAAAYMNEASNSWVLTGASSAPIDPYGAC